jgi:hypothetical protein
MRPALSSHRLRMQGRHRSVVPPRSLVGIQDCPQAPLKQTHTQRYTVISRYPIPAMPFQFIAIWWNPWPLLLTASASLPFLYHGERDSFPSVVALSVHLLSCCLVLVVLGAFWLVVSSGDRCLVMCASSCVNGWLQQGISHKLLYGNRLLSSCPVLLGDAVEVQSLEVIVSLSYYLTISQAQSRSLHIHKDWIPSSILIS